MRCLHPYCPTGHGHDNWEQVLEDESLRIRRNDKDSYLRYLSHFQDLAGAAGVEPELIAGTAGFKRVLAACPCLYAQIRLQATARATVHFCEITLGRAIDSHNVFDAFKIQHPNILEPTYAFPPCIPSTAGGDIMEQLCSEVLTNHGIPHMDFDEQGWPTWGANRHLSLNGGRMTPLKLYGDILIPAAPHNILVSVKSEAARERFVVSGNRLESVGFGFFNDASEFWTTSRMNLLKRWGFSAIYMPRETLDRLLAELDNRGTTSAAVNINGRQLFRPLEEFGDDMVNIAGKLSMSL